MKEEAPPKPEKKKKATPDMTDTSLSSIEIMLQDAAMHNNFTQAVMTYGMTAFEFIEPLRKYFSVRGIVIDKTGENKNKMKIEVGKYYKTRKGDKARIYATDGGFGNQIHGAVLRSNGSWILMWWREDGKFPHDKKFDIVSEWTEPLDFNKYRLPAWAEWIAMDRDGVWRWSVNKMTILCDRWECTINEDAYDIGYVPAEYAPKNYTGDWKDSLRKVSDL